VQALHRRRRAEINLLILRWRKRDRISSAPLHPRKCQRFITVFLARAEEADRRGEQPVDCDLDIGSHVAGKLPHRGHELVRPDAFEMPGEGVAGMFELYDVVGIGHVGFTRGLARDPQGMSAGANARLRRIEQRFLN
jgi:hypothetical protein